MNIQVFVTLLALHLTTINTCLNHVQMIRANSVYSVTTHDLEIEKKLLIKLDFLQCGNHDRDRDVILADF